MAIFQDIALGLDEAKIAVYNVMKKQYPRIEQSRSTLTNALISGMAYLYSMYQVFSRLVLGEHYISQARELSSLYELAPLAGLTFDQPITMKLEAAATPQDATITDASDPELYIESGGDPIIDADGNKFDLRTQAYPLEVLFDLAGITTSLRVSSTASNDNYNLMDLSAGRQLGDKYYPLSLYDSDSIVLQVPYKFSNEIRYAKLRFQDVGSAPVDAGSTNWADVTPSACNFNNVTGRFTIVLKTTCDMKDADLAESVVNMTATVRSFYKRNTIKTGLNPYSYTLASAASTYHQAFISNNLGSLVFSSGSTVNDRLGILIDVPIDPATLVLQDNTIAAFKFDFANAEDFDGGAWGTVKRATMDYDPGTGTKTYYAYILDEKIGAVIFEKAVGSVFSTGFTMKYTEAYNNKVLLEQKETKVKSVNPSTSFNFDELSYTLEDEDNILFEEVAVQVNDSAYIATTFEEIADLVQVQGDSTKTYFEVSVLAPNKVKIFFEDVIDYTSIDTVLVTYKTVKGLTSYSAGKTLSGAVKLYEEDMTQYDKAGQTLFNFDFVNDYASNGAAGVPTLESLRSTLRKAAYTLDSKVTHLNYESAIEAFFVSQGYEALVKVFEYEDFGLTFLDWTNGNVVFYTGLVNRLPNSDLVLTVNSDMSTSLTGSGAEAGQYSRSELDTAIPTGLTDIELGVIARINDNATDSDSIREALKNDSVMTNYLLAQASYIKMYGVYFKLKVRARDGYTYSQAVTAIKLKLAELFAWTTTKLARDIAVSDVYAMLDALPPVDKILFTNFSHYHNDSSDIKVADIIYKTIFDRITLGTDATANNYLLVLSGSTGSFSNNEEVTFAPSGAKGIIPVGATPTEVFIYQGIPQVSDVMSNDLATATRTVTSITSSGRRLLAENNAGGGIIKLPQLTGSISATAGANTLTDAGSGFVTGGFYPGMQITVSGFTNAANNVTSAKVTAVTAATITIASADATLVTEGPVASVVIIESVDMKEDWGFAEGRLVDISGWPTASNDGENAEVLSASATQIQVNKTLTLEVGDYVQIDDDSERMENPLWDFSNAATRQIVIDILGLGGVDTEPY